MNRFAEALDSGNFVSGSACTDCYSAIVADGPENPDPSWNRERMLETLADYEVTPGHAHDGPWSECSHKGEPCEEDCDCEQDTFSAFPCSLCGSTLAGTRDAVTLIARSLLGGAW